VPSEEVPIVTRMGGSIGKPALIATIAVEDVSRAYEKGETKGVYEDPSRPGEQTDSVRLSARPFRRRGHSLHSRFDVCQGGLDGSATGNVHSSYRGGVHPDDPGGSAAVAIIMVSAKQVGKVDWSRADKGPPASVK